GQGGSVAEAFLNNDDVYGPSINDAAVVSFAAVVKHGSPSQVYRWENGTISVVADAGTDIPGFGKVFGGLPIGGNNNNGAILITVQAKKNGPTDLFLWNNGQFTPVAVDGK